MYEKLIQIEKPDIEGFQGSEFFKKIFSTTNMGDYLEALAKTESPKYLYWDKLKYKDFIPSNFDKKEFWAAVKFHRSMNSELTPIKDESGQIFRWVKLAAYDKFLHETDLNFGGSLSSKYGISKAEKDTFITRGLMEEAISSSQLEGAHTTRDVAKKMLREGREPTNKAERMIVNNYKTMLLIEQRCKGEALSIELLMELHKKITEGTLDKEEQGRIRNKDEQIVIQPNDDPAKISFIAPDVEFVKKELSRLIEFANDKLEHQFIHPVIKAILLHFWIGYLHPFTDGNGRLARVLFYWYLLRKDYWAFSFLPISEKIKKSASAYSWAYIYTEQDDNDLTYFLDYNIRKIKLAQKEFDRYREKKAQDNKDAYKTLGARFNLNDRQSRLLQFLFENANERTNVSAHVAIYNVTRATAIKDLKELVAKNILYSKKIGVHVFYYLHEGFELV